MPVRTVEIQLSGRLTVPERSDVGAFIDCAHRLGEVVLARPNTHSAINGKLTMTAAGVSGSATLPSDEQLAQLYLAFRHFVLKKARSNFLRIVKIIERYAVGREAKEAVQSLETKWRSALFKGTISIGLEGRPLTADRIIDLWFNGELFHSDVKKRAELDQIRQAFGPELTKFMLVDSVYNGANLVGRLRDGLKHIVD